MALVVGCSIVFQIMGFVAALRLLALKRRALGGPVSAAMGAALAATVLESGARFAVEPPVWAREWSSVAILVLSAAAAISLLWLNRFLSRLDKAQAARAMQADQLTRRQRELDALFEFAKLREGRSLSIDDLLARAVEILSRAFSCENCAGVSVTCQGKVYATSQPKTPMFGRKRSLAMGGEVCGSVTVELGEGCAGPVDDANRADIERFLESVASLLGEQIERRLAELEAQRHHEYFVQAQRMDSLSIFVSGVAHEINNPNHLIMSGAGTLLNAWEDLQPILDAYAQERGDFSVGGMSYAEMKKFAPELLRAILEGGTHIKEIVQELRDFATQGPTPMEEDIDVNAVVKSAVTLLTNTLRKRTDCFSIEFGEDLPTLRGSYRRLEQALIAIIDNASQALPSRQAFVRVSTYYDAMERSVTIEVADGGDGIPAEILSYVTSPFFTTRRAVGGRGLGLPIASSIVQEHGGELRIASTPGERTQVQMILPVEKSGSNAPKKTMAEERLFASGGA